MNSSGEAAESVVRISIQGVEMTLRVVGSASKELIAFLCALSKNHQKTKGKTSLVKMLKSGKELKVFSIKKEDLKKFAEEAKRYGVLYHAIVNKKESPDGLIDIMVRTEDAGKINRIIEKFNLSTTDNATIKNEIKKEKEKSRQQENSTEKKEKTADDLVDEILSTSTQEQGDDFENPEKSPQLDPSYKNNKVSEDSFKGKQPKQSVKKQLKEIKEGLDKRDDNKVPEGKKQKTKQKANNKRSKKKKKIKERG